MKEHKPTDPAIMKAGRWLQRRAENVAVVLLAAMFLAFILQIVFRYLINFPIGWTSELSSITWIWLVLWGAALVLRENEEIRFDIVYGAARPRVRRAMIVSVALSVIALYAISLPAVFEYVTFMKVERSSYLDIRFDYLFSIYLLFAVATIVRYLWLGWRALLGETETIDPTKPASGI